MQASYEQVREKALKMGLVDEPSLSEAVGVENELLGSINPMPQNSVSTGLSYSKHSSEVAHASKQVVDYMEGIVQDDVGLVDEERPKETHPEPEPEEELEDDGPEF